MFNPVRPEAFRHLVARFGQDGVSKYETIHELQHARVNVYGVYRKHGTAIRFDGTRNTAYIQRRHRKYDR